LIVPRVTVGLVDFTFSCKKASYPFGLASIVVFVTFFSGFCDEEIMTQSMNQEEQNQ
jgi:hypothetical protein